MVIVFVWLKIVCVLVVKILLFVWFFWSSVFWWVLDFWVKSCLISWKKICLKEVKVNLLKLSWLNVMCVMLNKVCVMWWSLMLKREKVVCVICSCFFGL